MASMYEEMSDEMAAEGEPESAEGEETAEAETAELDGEFAMLAEELGFKGDKAETLKKAIDRCVTLRDEGAYAAPKESPAEGDEDEDDLDL